MAQDFTHVPVLLEEVTELFSALPGGVIVDATLGGAGHAAAILESRADLGVLGIDRDEMARSRLQRGWPASGPVPSSGQDGSPSSVRSHRPAGAAKSRGPRSPGSKDRHRSWASSPTSGELAPARPGRARVCVLRPGPLDMRMDPSTGETAAELLDRIDLDSLTDLLRDNGEGRYARRIARALIAARPVTTTTQLVDVVDAAVPKAGRRRLRGLEGLPGAARRGQRRAG